MQQGDRVDITFEQPDYSKLATDSAFPTKPCPGMEKYGDCVYVTTNIGGYSYSCGAGNFCVNPESSEQCSRGFYCPANTSQPLYCLPGYYCSADTTQIYRCPAGYTCPLGTVNPVPCLLSNCPEGSKTSTKVYLPVIIVIAMTILVLLFRIRRYFTAKAAEKRQRELYQWVIKKQKRAEEETMIDVSEQHKNNFTIDFQNLRFELPDGKVILESVSGVFLNARTVAIMGASGSGKTTLLSLLSGKVEKTSGRICVNGKDADLSKLKKLFGYVPQEDIMIRELAVVDVLMHSALMRLPKSMTYREVKEFVHETIATLGLAHVMNSAIGSEAVRGISGGQRKRVNIGMELVADPQILFLDEPTSGLDSTTSYELCRMLKMIARAKNIPVAAVVHAPSSATFNEFDDLLLLGRGGKVVYNGPTKEAESYFALCGFPCPSNENRADFFLDVIMGKIRSQLDASFTVEDLPKYWNRFVKGQIPVEAVEQVMKTVSNTETSPKTNDYMLLQLIKDAQLYLGLSDDDDKKKPSEVKFTEDEEKPVMHSFTKKLNISYSSWVWWFKDIFNEITESILIFFNFVRRIPDPVRETPSLLTSLHLLLKRALFLTYRDEKAIIYDQAMHFFVGFLISFVSSRFEYFPALPETICRYSPAGINFICRKAHDDMQYAALFICFSALYCACNSAAVTFGKDKPVFWREASTGMSTLMFFIAKVVADLPRVFLSALLYAVGFSVFFTHRMEFSSLYLIVFGVYYTGFGMSYVSNILLTSSSASMTTVALSMLYGLILAGVTPNFYQINNEFPQFAFIWQLSTTRYAVEAFWTEEVSSRDFSISIPRNGYQWGNFGNCIMNMLLLGAAWHFFALVCIKLCDRRKMK